jgi:hypothetical protein
MSKMKLLKVSKKDFSQELRLFRRDLWKSRRNSRPHSQISRERVKPSHQMTRRIMIRRFIKPTSVSIFLPKEPLSITEHL